MEQLPKDKVKAKDGARFVQACDAQIPLVADIVVKNLKIALMLARQKAHGVARARRDTVDAGERDVFLKQNVEHAACVCAAGSPALKHKTNRHNNSSLRLPSPAARGLFGRVPAAGDMFPL